MRGGNREAGGSDVYLPAFFGPFGETGITPSKQCNSAPLPEVRCYVQTVVEPGTPRVGGRWSASIAPGQARALQQGRGAVAHRSPRWPRSPSPWHKRIVGSPPTGWPPTGNQDGKCKLRCAGLTAPADGPSFVTGQTLSARRAAPCPDATPPASWTLLTCRTRSLGKEWAGPR